MLSEYLPPREEAHEHCLCVSQVAERIALAAKEKVALDLEFVRSSALLHDIGRALTHHGTFHCWEGYLLMTRLDAPRHARVCMAHGYAGLSGEEASLLGLPAEDFRPRTWEEKIVTLADGLVEGNQVVDHRQRVRRVYERYRAKGADQVALKMIEAKIEGLIEEVEGVTQRPLEEILQI